MQFTLLQHGESINADHHIRVLIRKDQWQKWYDEMRWRFEANSRLKQQALHYRTFDTDEAQECGVIGIEHLQECLKFLAK